MLSKNEKIVSIIIPVYNSEKFIINTLESVINQTYQNLEIIIIDDGSTDNTREIIGKYIIDKRLKYFYQDNLGASSARNTGLKKSIGDYIAFLDSDDIWELNKIEKQLEYMNKNRNKDLVFSNCVVVDENLEYLYTHRNKLPKTKKNQIKAIFYGKIRMITPSILFRKEILDKINGFDTLLTHREDNLFLINIIEYFNIGLIEEELYKRRLRENSLSTEKNIEKLLIANEVFFMKLKDKYKFLNIRKEKSRQYYGIAMNCTSIRYKQLKYFLYSLFYDVFNIKSYCMLIIKILPFNLNIKKLVRILKK